MKKVVFLPYDFDTAIGINNEGALAFGYSLEDTDHVDGADVFNGQYSVLWTNLRDTFPDEIAAMYKQLRSEGTLSYATVERMFEEHQNKWPESIFNEDAKFKYLNPLRDDNDKTYLPMLQGSKAEQRKWWLFNRFRYMDSKFNAGDALTDYIQLRGYAKGDITLTPYADIYPTIKYGSYLVRTRGERNNSYTLTCPLDQMNDTEIYIYSASALASIGDVSQLMIGLADFSRAEKLQEVKIGDSDPNYDNPNVYSLSFGRNTLLKKVDARNCSGLGLEHLGGTQRDVDLSLCTGIEEAYFDGTNIASLYLPNGGELRKLHLPGTITYLSVRNQQSLSEFVCPDFSHITTLWLENPTTAIDTLQIVEDMPEGGRVRLFNFHWEMNTLDDVILMFNKLDTMRGLDQNGNNVNSAQVYGSIHVVTATGAQISAIQNRYPEVTITYNTLLPSITYMSSDGTRIITIESVAAGESGTKILPDAIESTAQYAYTPAGWSTTIGGTADPTALDNVTTDRVVYAVYTVTVQSYAITFIRGEDDGDDVLRTVMVAYGDTPVYGGANPTSTQGATFAFQGWDPELAPVTGPATYTAIFKEPVTLSYYNYDGSELLHTETVAYNRSGLWDGSPTREATAQFTFTFNGWSSTPNGSANATVRIRLKADTNVYAAYWATLRSYTITFVRDSGDGGGTLQTSTLTYGSLPVYNGFTPTTTRTGDYDFNGWNPPIVAVTGNATYTAKFRNLSPLTYQILNKTIQEFTDEYSDVATVRDYAFHYCTQLTSIDMPVATIIGSYAFNGCSKLTSVDLSEATTIGNYAFQNCSKLTSIDLPAATTIGNYAFNGCSKLTSVDLSEATTIGSAAFSSCTSLTSIDLPEATSIDGSAFYNCVKLTSVNLPEATSIGGSAFSYCTSLTSIDLPEATSIDGSAFYNCVKLTSVNLPEATSIGGSAFSYCTSLTSIDLPEATSIGSAAFSNCTSLTSIDLPEATSIDGSAFQNCTALTSVILRNTSQVATLGNTSAFNNAPNAIVYVPDALVDSYKSATNWSSLASRIKGLSELPE